MSEAEQYDERILMWRRLTENYRLADGLTHEALADEFDIDDENVAQSVCSQAFKYVMDENRTRFEFEDFEQAVEIVRCAETEEDDQDDEADDHVSVAGSELQQVNQEAENKGVDPDGGSEADDEPDRNQDPDPNPEPVDREQTQPAEADDRNTPVDTTSTCSPESMERPELEREVGNLRDRVDDLEGQVEKLQNVANRDVALLKGAFRMMLDAGDGLEIDELPELARAHRDRLDTQDEMLRKVGRTVDELDELTTDGDECPDRKLVLKRYMIEQAENAGGTYRMSAERIVDKFDGNISNSRGCQIIREIEDEDLDGFEVVENSGSKPMQLRATLDEMRQGSIYRLKNGSTGGSP